MFPEGHPNIGVGPRKKGLVMLKLCLTALVTLMVSRWMYAEVSIIVPGAMPVVDAVLDKTSIPTHDHWSKDSMERFYKRLALAYQGVQKAFSEPEAVAEEPDGNSNNEPMG